MGAQKKSSLQRIFGLREWETSEVVYSKNKGLTEKETSEVVMISGSKAAQDLRNQLNTLGLDDKALTVSDIFRCQYIPP